MIKFWEKKRQRTIADEIFELDGMDGEELAREDCTPERKKELRLARELNQRTLADIEKARIDERKGVKVALIGFAGTVATILGIVGWNTIQHKRNINYEDESQMELNRDPNSSVRVGSKIIESLRKK